VSTVRVDGYAFCEEKVSHVRPIVIAHRGASGTAPENTLPAFLRAVDVGAPMIELDVQCTRDGEVVVIHDWLLDRTTSGSGLVTDHTLAEIRACDAGGWFGQAFEGTVVPTLAEVLRAVPVAINVELKALGDDRIAAAALAVVEQAGALDRVVFSSFAYGLLERLRACSARAAIGLLWQSEPIAEALAMVQRVGATGVHLRKDATTAEAVAETGRAGLPVRVWTVNQPEEFDALADLGVAAIFTDFPERFLLKGDPGAAPYPR
jgi:glycerophosphoryl diester phosphodiesterase